MQHIRQATTSDLSRIAEMIVFNYRLNFYPIFHDDDFYFNEMQVEKLVDVYRESVESLWVYDDGSVKDVRAISFYERHGFHMTSDKKFEEATTEYLVRMSKNSSSQRLGCDFMKKLIVLFPGVGYGLDCPLLYYADFLYQTKGYERVHMNYQDIFCNTEWSLETKLEKVREYIREKVKNIDFRIYDDVVFLSKSIGTVEAGVLAEKLGIKVVQIFITPVEEAVSYCGEDSYVVIGTKDKAYQVYKTVCEENRSKALYVDAADHSLEIEGHPYDSIEVLKKVMQFIER